MGTPYGVPIVPPYTTDDGQIMTKQTNTAYETNGARIIKELQQSSRHRTFIKKKKKESRSLNQFYSRESAPLILS